MSDAPMWISETDVAQLLSLEEACKTNFPASKKLFQSKDLIEGPRAFAEKRKPNWKNE